MLPGFYLQPRFDWRRLFLPSVGCRLFLGLLGCSHQKCSQPRCRQHFQVRERLRASPIPLPADGRLDLRCMFPTPHGYLTAGGKQTEVIVNSKEMLNCPVVHLSACMQPILIRVYLPNMVGLLMRRGRDTVSPPHTCVPNLMMQKTEGKK